VLTLWASVVAERLGDKREEALSLGKAVAGLYAQLKGRQLSRLQPRTKSSAPSAPKPSEQPIHDPRLPGSSSLRHARAHVSSVLHGLDDQADAEEHKPQSQDADEGDAPDPLREQRT
jgi:hypothetical protein